MSRRVYKAIFVCLCLLLSVWIKAGVCVCVGETVLLPNARTDFSAGEAVVSVQATHTGEYLLYAVSQGTVEVCVRRAGAVLAQGVLPVNVSLVKDEEIELEFSAEAEFTFELMRMSTGRNMVNPIPLTDDTLSRTFTRAYDVHWFSFTAPQTGDYAFKAVRTVKSGVSAQLLLLTQEGTVLAETRMAEDASGAMVRMNAGESCLVRVQANGAETGNYTLYTFFAEGEDVPLSAGRDVLLLKAGEWTHVSVEGAQAVLWQSDDISVATVSSEGVVAAVSEGECVVSAYASRGRVLTLPVRVSRADVLGVAFAHTRMKLSQGEQTYVEYAVQPTYAGNRNVKFSSSDENVVAVDDFGLLTAVGVGEATVTVCTEEGGFTDRMTVNVEVPATVYRALAVGIASYADGRVRTGCVNTTQGVADALAQSRWTQRYTVVTRIDVTWAELLEALDEAFAGAKESDVSLLYINCHGNMVSGIAYLEMNDGTRVTARQLERVLRKVPGRVIVILDCCFSGAFIGRDRNPDAFNHGVVNVFSQSAIHAGNVFGSDKYRVLVSSSMDQNSYRIASASPITEDGMATVFARSFTEALGWDLIKDKAGTIKADMDGNRQVTLHEAFLYTRKRCMYYLTRSPESSARQAVQVWPEGDVFVIVK